MLEACVLLMAFLRMLDATKLAFVGFPFEQPRSIVDSVAAAIQKEKGSTQMGNVLCVCVWV